VPSLPPLSAALLAPVLAVGALTAAAAPARAATAGGPLRLSDASALLSADRPSSPQAGQTFSGLPQFGALVWQKGDGSPGRRLCTAVAVDSPNGDPIATAAHCAGVAQSVAFLPGSDGASTPYGVWSPTRVIRAQQWTAVKDPDFDIAFLTVVRGDENVPLEAVTGAEHFGTVPPADTLAAQVGYADNGTHPLVCRAAVRFQSPTQLRIDCAGFPSGTSGGPLLTDVDPATGVGTLVGVVGGYQSGGASPSVSYAAAFTPAVQALYRQAQQY
jgi:hypothetical protein